jgi:predicted amidophosphoribosyltransferase
MKGEPFTCNFCGKNIKSTTDIECEVCGNQLRLPKCVHCEYTPHGPVCKSCHLFSNYEKQDLKEFIDFQFQSLKFISEQMLKGKLRQVGWAGHLIQRKINEIKSHPDIVYSKEVKQ